MADRTFQVEQHFLDGNAQDIRRCRPLRGRVIVQLEPEEVSRLVWTPTPEARSLRIHTGRVVSFGDPARTPSGAEVRIEFAVGDRVLFCYALSLEKSRRFADGLTFVAQEEIVAVLGPRESRGDA